MPRSNIFILIINKQLMQDGITAYSRSAHAVFSDITKARKAADKHAQTQLVWMEEDNYEVATNENNGYVYSYTLSPATTN